MLSWERLVGSLQSLRADEAGAVTIDWVTLTAGILLLGIMVVYAIFNGGVSTVVSNINSSLVDVESNISEDPNLRTGNASERGCVRSGKFVVCMGPM